MIMSSNLVHIVMVFAHLYWKHSHPNIEECFKHLQNIHLFKFVSNTLRLMKIATSQKFGVDESRRESTPIYLIQKFSNSICLVKKN
jgi:hypothetical protein